MYKNLTVEVVSSDNDSTLEFNALTDLCAEIVVRLANSIFVNHERARLDMKKQEDEISKKCDSFDDDDDKKDDIFIKMEDDFLDFDNDDVLIKKESDNEMDDRETIPYTSLKRKNDNEIDDRETILFASPKRESQDEIDKNIYKEPKLETLAEI